MARFAAKGQKLGQVPHSQANLLPLQGRLSPLPARFVHFNQRMFGLFALFAAALLSAQDITSATQIKTLLDNYMSDKISEVAASGKGQLSYSVRGLDPRLRLKACDSEPSVAFQANQWLKRRAHVEVVCVNPQWRMLVGLELQLIRPVYVAMREIARQEPVSEKVELADIDILTLYDGYIDDLDALERQVAKQPIKSGAVISARTIKAQILVDRNSLVQINAQIGRITVTSQGVALEAGGFGDIIQIRNKSSNKIVEATVKSTGQVAVLL